MSQPAYVAIGDGLTTGHGDPGVDGRPIGWARRLHKLLVERTGVDFAFTNLARDGAALEPILTEQVSAACRADPVLITLTAGVNDIRGAFDEQRFLRTLEMVFTNLAESGATVVTMTIPDLSAKLPVSVELRGMARELLVQANQAIRRAARDHGVLYVNAWHTADISDDDFWCEDDLYPSPYGHQVIAGAFADLLWKSAFAERFGPDASHPAA